MSLLIAGTVAFDAIETPFGKTDKIIGGSGMYASLAASFFANTINLVSIVGDDFPLDFFKKFKTRGIDTDGVEIKKDRKSFFWSGKYHLDMNSRDTLITDLNVLEEFNPILPASYKKCDYLLLGNIDPALQLKVIKQLKTRPKLIAMDTMNFWMNINRKDLDKVLKKVDLLLINDEEARQLSGEYALAKAAKRIMQMGPQFLIIKKGEHGALLFNSKTVFSAPALPLEVVFDPTGAGDAFAGGFMGFIAQTKNHSFTNMKRAIIYGSTMASFCVEKFGAERLMEIKQPQVKKRVKEFVQLAKFEIN